VLVADMRELPPLGTFDLAFALCDAVNFLLSAGELGAALASVPRPGYTWSAAVPPRPPTAS